MLRTRYLLDRSFSGVGVGGVATLVLLAVLLQFVPAAAYVYADTKEDKERRQEKSRQADRIETEEGPPRVNFQGFCESQGRDILQLHRKNDPNSWGCVKKDGTDWIGIDVGDACRWQFGAEYEPRLAGGGDPFSWYCERPTPAPAPTLAAEPASATPAVTQAASSPSTAAPPPTEPQASSSPVVCPEPNEQPENACTISQSGIIPGTIQSIDDHDLYKISITAPSRVHLSLTGLGSDIDLHLVGVDGAIVAESRNRGISEEAISVFLTEPGAYHCYVYASPGEPHTPDARYTLFVFVGDP